MRKFEFKCKSRLPLCAKLPKYIITAKHTNSYVTYLVEVNESKMLEEHGNTSN